MAERDYSIEDIKQFLKDEYNLDWREREIIDNGRKVCINDKHFNQSCLRAQFIVYRGKAREIYLVSISNQHFNVYGKNNQHKSRIWQKLLKDNHNQMQTNCNKYKGEIMEQRNYKLKDIYDYLLKYYNIEWVGYNVLDKEGVRHIQEKDLGGINRQATTELSVVAVVYNGSKNQTVWLNVSNNRFGISVEQKPEVDWLEFLADRYGEQSILGR